MKPARARYITGSNLDSTSRQLEIGLTLALKLTSESRGGLLLTCSMLEMLSRIEDSLERILGQAVTRRLRRDHRIDGVLRIEVLTDAKVHTTHSWNGVVLMIYPSEKMLNHVGEMLDVAAEVCVPWDEARTNPWRAAWNAIPVGTAPKQVVFVGVPKNVAAALKSLTQIVNLNNHLATERDRKDALRYLAMIERFSPEVDGAAVRAYLMGACGWDGKTATEAHELFDGIRAGKRFRGQPEPDEQLWKRICEQAVVT